MSDTDSFSEQPVDLAERAQELSAKLAGLLLTLTVGSDQFATLTAGHRNAVLWLASDMAVDLKQTVDNLV